MINRCSGFLLSTLFLAAGAVVLTACNDDSVVGPENPAPTMDNIWPHADGNAWIYDLAVRSFAGDPDAVFPADGSMPPLPTMEELHAAMDQDIVFEARGQSDGLYRMAFEGDITTESGVTAQHLTEELFLPVEGLRRVSSHEDRLLGRILAARPDLRGRVACKDIGDELKAPILLGGYAFEATADGIYSYGDVDQDHSWTYLEGDLTVGSEFSIQLLSAFTDDLFLYGRIWNVGDYTVGGMTYANCVECFYLVDLGVTPVVDEFGMPLGNIRAYIFGSVYFAPDIGPVYCHEKSHTVMMGFPAGEAVIMEYEAALTGGLQIRE